MKPILFLCFLLQTIFSVAQVGINTTAPDVSASLDISSANSGLLIPRVSLLNVSDATSPINAPAVSLLVYNTNAAIVAGNGVGYYYWNGAIWTKLNVSSDEKWTRNPATNSLFPTTITDNVGIGTNSPTARLEIVDSGLTEMKLGSTAGFGGARFSMWSDVGTASEWRPAYLEDSDNGNFTGRLDFYTNGSGIANSFGSVRAMSLVNGNVGIGTTTPSEKLEISGKIKITDGSQATGRVLVSDATGVGTWTNNIALTPAVLGTFGNGVTIGNGYGVGTITPSVYTGAYITLPPGKWMVFGTFLLQCVLPNNASMFVRSSFSCSDTVNTNCDIVTGLLISGVISGPNEFGLSNGQTVIWNQSAGPKTYYLWANVRKYGAASTTTHAIAGFASNFFIENMMTAIPMN